MKILDVPQSGSLAGVTSSRNRFGQYRRSRAIPVNPSTSFQAAVRARFSTAAVEWRILTAAQRAGWADLGLQMNRTDSIGSSYNLTGFQAYLSVRTNMVAAGDTPVPDAPLYTIPDSLASVTPTISSASMSIAWTPTPVGAGERVFVSASPQRSAGRAFEGDTRLIQVTAAAGASPLVILTNYSARFGAPVTGSRIFIVVQRYKAGFLSPSLITSAIVT